MAYPLLIQGGMGAGVSGWQLAREVSRLGHLGVVAGTALDAILARYLQEGDPGGHFRRAIDTFPFPAIAERALRRYFIAGGKSPDAPYRSVPIHSLRSPQALVELTVLANYVEVYLAKEGHDGVVGINYLEKIQLPNLASLYGAMLADIDYVLMGAGIPREIPGALDLMAAGREASTQLSVVGAARGEEDRVKFDPRSLAGDSPPQLSRPRFLPIVSSVVLAKTLIKRATGHIEGFVIEGPGAGGHNAPPRGALTLDETGQPIYGDRDRVDLTFFRELGRPFWLAGAYGHPDRIAEALAAGATGVQVGTPFAFCAESGLEPALRATVLDLVRQDAVKVFTDPAASPTGFPFKLMPLAGTLADPQVYAARPRTCDLGFLRTAYRTADGGVGFRCPGEPEDDYLRKGGDAADTAGRQCLCNGLVANIGLGQVRAGGYREPAILTCGEDLSVLQPYLDRTNYSAAVVVDRLCDGLAAAQEAHSQ